jgi:hypothetical protein
MPRKLYTIVMAAAVLAGVFGVGISGPMVASAAGMGPADALAPAGEWATEAPSQRIWYAFQYSGDGSQILVRMAVDSSNPASFEVWTADQILQWVHGDTVTPVGRGSANDAFGGDLVWSGNFNEPGTYFVIVSNTSLAPEAYDLQITGDAVTQPSAVASPQPATSPSAAGSPAAAASAAAKPTVVVQGGTGPSDALPISGAWAPLAVGQQVWYAFSYSGDGSEITVRMTADQNNAASFAVWTPDEARQLALDSTTQPVGRGSEDDSLRGDQVWAGSFNTGGTYYVVVTQTGQVPANYQLSIN